MNTPSEPTRHDDALDTAAEIVLREIAKAYAAPVAPPSRFVTVTLPDPLEFISISVRLRPSSVGPADE